MRNILIPLSVASVLFLAVGCEKRNSMQVTQDKQGHAYVPDGAQTNAKDNVPLASEGEIYISTGPKDTLTSISKKYNVPLSWLIKRNELKDVEAFKDGIPPGTNLIVPNPAVKR